ncbi:DUF3750 domain-containing protein [Rhizobium halophytocola]|uniref:DUF3750 domain-containing protein n=1 Tax=Rhizobium halophytocola TaxID=735519 RepID=A0ABS4DX75_9HYPH|nr:DUF3750 domain-containing protein [Rhizobium halophytocola]MBP1850234.1 hypothetical protein [Rhizobium halophytocola]
MKFLKRLLLTLVVVFILPPLVSAGLWISADRPQSYRDANWSSAGILPRAGESRPAAIYVFSAMTGGLKGAVASHAWIVTKARDAAAYTRYDKLGWGTPIRRNSRAADAYWYSNRPRLVAALHGESAERLIPKVEAAIAGYPHARPGDYRIYPGPNSNSFAAHVLRQVPELGAVLPPDAVGRDYLAGGQVFFADSDGRDYHLSLGGLAGINAGARSGLEINLFGLVFGVAPDLALKVPAFGMVRPWAGRRDAVTGMEQI